MQGHNHRRPPINGEHLMAAIFVVIWAPWIIAIILETFFDYKF